MYKERIVLFKSENPNSIFPNFREMTSIECDNLATALSKKFLGTVDNGIELVNKLHRKAMVLKNVNAAIQNFSLLGTLQQQGVTYIEIGYIDWYRFDRTTQMKMQDINSFFEYLYFPSADDIQVFDSSMSWLLFIDHDGEVFILK